MILKVHIILLDVLIQYRINLQQQKLTLQMTPLVRLYVQENYNPHTQTIRISLSLIILLESNDYPDDIC